MYKKLITQKKGNNIADLFQINQNNKLHQNTKITTVSKCSNQDSMSFEFDEIYI